jgi:hypothetical protein
MILAEQDDEWQDGRRYFRPETTTAIDAVAIEEVDPAAPARGLIRPGAGTTGCHTTSCCHTTSQGLDPRRQDRKADSFEQGEPSVGWLCERIDRL